METSVKHFVRKILGIHLLLLALLLTVVILAARHVYQSARLQAVAQARALQASLAEQTAHGISGFYNSILSDLNLIKPADEDESDLPDLPQSQSQGHPFGSIGIIRQAVGMLLVHQLEDRARLILIDEKMRPHMLGVDERPFGLRNKKPSPTAASTASGETLSFEQQIVDRFGPWLKTTKEPAISKMAMIDQREIKLVCVPLVTTQKIGAAGRGLTLTRTSWLVAAVSAKPIERNFLIDLGLHGASGAFLVDESMTVMAAARHDLVGTRLDASADPGLHQTLTELAPANYSATRLLNAPFHIGSQSFEPSMISACPVKVMDKRWFVLVTSPLKDVDQIVRELARQALFWAVFVALSMTGILVSTAAQLILSRMKMERVRHQLLQNEMRQARQIQLAWLPQKTKTTCGDALLDVASLNRPATHISGDFYNFFPLPNGRTAVVIGDVTGHGTAAAFLMATTQLLLRNTLPQYCDPGRCLEEVNRQLTSQVFNGQFVTMQVLVIDSRSGDVAIATAGHPAPLMSDGDEFMPVELEPQLVAGVDPDMRYPTEHFNLRPGESLLLYTDGVVETENPSGKRLRLEGLRQALAGHDENAEALLQRAVAVVNTFRRGEHLHDDLTMVAVHLFPQPRRLPHADILPAPAEAEHAAQVG